MTVKDRHNNSERYEKNKRIDNDVNDYDDDDDDDDDGKVDDGNCVIGNDDNFAIIANPKYQHSAFLFPRKKSFYLFLDAKISKHE